MKAEWTIIVASIVAVAAAAAAASLVPEPDVFVRQREVQRELVRLRDPDKSRLYYASLRDIGSHRTFWFGSYGDSLRHVATADGVETYQVDQWQAVEGPDYIKCRLTIRFKDMIASGMTVEPVAPGATC